MALPRRLQPAPNRRGRALRHNPRMVTCGEGEQGLPYRCRWASDRIAVAIRLWQQPAARASADTGIDSCREQVEEPRGSLRSTCDRRAAYAARAKMKV